MSSTCQSSSGASLPSTGHDFNHPELFYSPVNINMRYEYLNRLNRDIDSPTAVMLSFLTRMKGLDIL